MAELNRLTTILLDMFDDQLRIGRLTMMVQAENFLNIQLANLGRNLPAGGGAVKRIEADTHAKEQYEIFDERRRAIRHAEADAAIAAIKATEKSLPKSKGRKRS